MSLFYSNYEIKIPNLFHMAYKLQESLSPYFVGPLTILYIMTNYKKTRNKTLYFSI